MKILKVAHTQAKLRQYAVQTKNGEGDEIDRLMTESKARYKIKGKKQRSARIILFALDVINSPKFIKLLEVK